MHLLLIYEKRSRRVKTHFVFIIGFLRSLLSIGSLHSTIKQKFFGRLVGIEIASPKNKSSIVKGVAPPSSFELVSSGVTFLAVAGWYVCFWVRVPDFAKVFCDDFTCSLRRTMGSRGKEQRGRASH